MFNYLGAILTASALFLAGCGGGSSACCGDTSTVVEEEGETAKSAPTAVVLSTQSICTVGESITFDGLTSSDDDGTVSSYHWRIADEIVSTNAQPTLICEVLGVQNVCLTVTDNDGLTSKQVCKSITVNEVPKIKPEAKITAVLDTYTIGTMLSADGTTSSDTDGEVEAYRWVFGTQSSTEQKPNFLINTLGEQQLCLTVTDNDALESEQNCTTITGLAVPNIRPIADFNPDDTSLQCTEDDTLTLNGISSSDQDGEVVSYSWNKETLNGASTFFDCDKVGEDEICLSVTDDGNLSSEEICKTITIAKKANIAPTAVISNVASECIIGDQVLPDAALSSDADGNVTAYQWTVDTIAVSTEQKPVFACDKEGAKVICLTVKDNDATESQTICSTIIGKAPVIPQPQTVPPVAVITYGGFDGDGFYFDCARSYDGDAIDSDQTPQNDANVITNSWSVIKYFDNGSVAGPHGNTICKKWIGTPENLDYMEVTLSVTDDDGEENSTTKTYTFENGILTEQ